MSAVNFAMFCNVAFRSILFVTVKTKKFGINGIDLQNIPETIFLFQGEIKLHLFSTYIIKLTVCLFRF